MGDKMIQAILTILQNWVWDARREAYWPSSIELYGKQIGFLVYLCAALAVIILLVGLYRNMRVWFQGKYDQEEQGFLGFIIALIKQYLLSEYYASLG